MSRNKILSDEPKKIIQKHAYWLIDELDNENLGPAQKRLEHMLHLMKSFFPRIPDASD